MSASFERLIDGIIDALQSHVVPNSSDDFVRGQVFSAIYALNGLKLAADWKAGPLLEQVRLQDDTFAAVKRLADGAAHPMGAVSHPDYASARQPAAHPRTGRRPHAACSR